MPIHHEHPIVQKLSETNLDLHLVGSRFMGSHSDHSDYDFYCARTYSADTSNPHRTQYVDATLEQLGFKKIGNAGGSGYQDDGALSEIWRWTDPAMKSRLPSVDVLTLAPTDKEYRMECLHRIRDNGYYRGPGQKLVAALKGQGEAWCLLFNLMREKK